MKRSGPMKRVGFKRTSFVGTTKSGIGYSGHSDKPMDAESRKAFEAIVDAAAKHPGFKKLMRKPMRRRSKRMAKIYAGEECGMCRGDGEIDIRGATIETCPSCGGVGKVEGRAAFVARVLKERPTCQVCHIIGAHLAGLPIPPLKRVATDPVWDRCGRDSVDVHELAKRSHTGSKRKREILTDDDNVLAVCRNGHAWIETNGKAAIKLGLSKSRYEGRNP